MLHKETIDLKTLELLSELQKEPLMQTFNLVDSTALALRLGHRKSIDLDFFTSESFDLEELRSMLVEKYDFKISYARSQTLKGFINRIKIDLIKFNYPHLFSCDVIDGIRLESVPDIIAMKLLSITDNGSRIKDFIDIAFLSSYYSLEEMLDFYVKKIPNSNKLMPLKALTYFNDINFNESVVMMSGNFNWQKIADHLHQMTENSDKLIPHNQ